VISPSCKAAGVLALSLTLGSTGKIAIAKTARSIVGAVPYALFERERLIHDGSFKVPDGFDYQGTALSFNAAANSLFIANSQSLGEITIPAIGDQAALLQPPVDPADGLSVGAADTRIGGTLVYGDQLYFTKYVYYDATDSQRQSLFVRSLDLSAPGTVRGPFQVGPLRAGFYSGYMTHVPEALQGTLGGPVLTGNCCLNIISRTSFGPAAFALDPVMALTRQNAAPLVYYPSDHATLGAYNGVTTYFGGSDNMGGIVVPDGYGSVLFFGQHGTTFCYGGTECNDPTSPYQGVHGYPYLSYVWAYRVDDLGDVRARRKQPWEIKPYATWTLSELGGAKIGGVAYDQARRKLFVSQLVGDGARPLIHVYTIR